ncbi:MAG: hypothetical protein V1712_02540 [Patescibacteria group bacterium]
MKKLSLLCLLLVLIALCISAVSAGGRKSKKTAWQPGDEIRMGYGFYYETPGAYGMHLKAGGVNTNIGLGVMLSPGVEIGKVVRFENYSLSGDLLISLDKEFETYLTLGWRHTAEYTSAYGRNQPISWFNGPTVGVGYDLWQPKWLPYDRITINAQWWFFKTVSALQNMPAPRRLVISLTYYFI